MSATAAPARRAVEVPLAALAQSLGHPFPALVGLGLEGGLSLDPAATAVEPVFVLRAPHPERLAQRGISDAVLAAGSEALLIAAHHRAAREARRLGRPLAPTWRVSGALARAAAQQLRARSRAEARAESRMRAARARAELAKLDAARAAAKRAAPPPPTPEEAERALVAEITALARRTNINIDKTTNLAALTAPGGAASQHP